MTRSIRYRTDKHMKAKSKAARPRSAEPRRSKRDWIDVATRALARDGIGAVRVEALARELGVTKGSFYWHFADLEALLVAIYEAWEESGTQHVIALVESGGGSAEERLWRLRDLTSEPGIGPELALRDVARRDPRVAAIVERVDDQRMEYLRSLYAAHGCSLLEAEARAMIAYSLLIGSYFIRARHGRRSRKAVLEHSFAMLLRKPEG